MTVPTAARVVRIRRYLDAPPERVFTAWTDPDVLARWISPVGHAVVSIDPRPGGRLQVTMVGEGRQIEHVGEYREIIPNRRLVFTWQSSYTGPDPSVVTIELESRDGGTELTLVHAALPHDAVDSHAGGWSHILDRLAAVLRARRQQTATRGNRSHEPGRRRNDRHCPTARRGGGLRVRARKRSFLDRRRQDR